MYKLRTRIIPVVINTNRRKNPQVREWYGEDDQHAKGDQ
jgi:hypothetical protein